MTTVGTTFTNGIKAKTFKVPRLEKLLDLSHTEWAEAEVTVRLAMSIGEYLEIKRLSDEVDTAALLQTFGDKMLVRWNLVDDNDKPLLPTGESMVNLPNMTFALAIVTEWLRAVAGVSAPLVEPSDVGDMLVAASIALGES